MFLPWCVIVALALASTAHAQVLVSDQERRDAFTHYQAGQDLLSAEQWEKAAVAFEVAITGQGLKNGGRWLCG